MGEKSVQHVEIAIIGSGPAGLSAAVTAAKNGVSHLLLERAPQLADTIFKYQKGKAVMAQPMHLPLVADLPFEAGSREAILAAWRERAAAFGVCLRCNAEVKTITGSLGAFTVAIEGQEPIAASRVVLAIGLQGNLRRLGLAGENRGLVQYQLDDPDEYRNERIMVIGAGDSAIENALALAGHNDVSIVNRAAEFLRAQPGNLVSIERALRRGVIRCYFSARPVRLEDRAVVLMTAEGEVVVPCDRVIARLGAIPPRSFVESCGIEFPSKDPVAVPELSPAYESNVPGLYIVGALAGYNLIKQAINQGWEVAERLAGNAVEPADQTLLAGRLAEAYPGVPVATVPERVWDALPMFYSLTTLQLRDLMLDSVLHRFPAGSVVFRQGDYTNSLFNIIEGRVRVDRAAEPGGPAITIGPGRFFGELGLISGRRRSVTIVADTDVLALETQRRTVLRLQRSVRSVKAALDRVALRRMIHNSLGPDRPATLFEDAVAAAELISLDPGAPAISEGDPCDALYIVQRGSMTVTKEIGGARVSLGFIAAGQIFGERGLLDPAARRAATVRAAVAAEVIRVEGEAIRRLMAAEPSVREIFQQAVQHQFDASVESTILHGLPERPGAVDDEVIPFLVAQGIGEATNALIIDEALCVGCDNCEKACAATHGGITRLHREAGASFASVKVPIACRHCERPHCMSDCPVDAITRAPSGEVLIADTCIGCGNCVRDCPYEVITLAAETAPVAGPWDWLRRSLGLAPLHASSTDGGAGHKRAVKCDLCKDVGGGPACVRACPTGAAARLAPEEYLALVRDGSLPNRRATP
jgi:thioredoxin reductase/CRP-like cAMP-binding protein/Fe-S-cluster-containing hydrogenase component 2